MVKPELSVEAAEAMCLKVSEVFLGERDADLGKHFEMIEKYLMGDVDIHLTEEAPVPIEARHAAADIIDEVADACCITEEAAAVFYDRLAVLQIDGQRALPFESISSVAA